ncbi:retropepsin-like aspartic protease family protein [Microbulbifer agarilyticus]|uniref:retropepsin-like aspartic protease family protein n=1 Tax=Microbulbifer agarilyticus TaxID=260552 RepID=UPI001CD4A68B|nr:TIGR02281 family clan AA aspartic protease [Microbulbifer agarilyticus]MCA0892774.1 TIGR02281 family clan AA aspartic protease [Microbulbifer agarilyticus]
MKLRGLFILAVTLLVPVIAGAQEVRLQAIFGTSAMFEVNGKQRLLKSGKTSPEGVTLVSVTSEYALVRIDGREQKLTLAAPVAANYAEAQRAEVRLNPDSRGHYSTTAWINGRRVNVMVDTGATSIAFNYPTAKSLGLDLSRARPMTVSTASGVEKAYRLQLASVTIGGITVHNVEATVLGSDFPSVTLLGNSFLSRVDMQQQDGLLLLRARN